MVHCSNALDISSLTRIVLSAGLGLLKPEEMKFVISWRAVDVECLALKPC